MTVGLYIHEPESMMISDCLALPTDSDVQLYSPSNIEFYDGTNGELATLVSKFIQADDRTLIAFAGAYRDIKEFVEGFLRLWSERDLSMRPMEYLHDLDYRLRQTRNSWSCSVLGASVLPAKPEDTHFTVNNYASLSENWTFDTNHFGKCFAVGSGSSELRKIIENTDTRLDQYGPMGENFLYETLGALNGAALFAQQEPVENQKWGGLLQCQIYNLKAQKWIRSPPWFHMCILYKGKELTFKGIHNKTVLHTNKLGDENASAVVTHVMKGDGKRQMIIWPVYSPFLPEEQRASMTLDDCFKIPNAITFTAFVEIDGSIKVNHRTYHVDAVKGVKFEKKGNEFATRINENELAEWLRQRILDDAGVSDFLN